MAGGRIYTMGDKGGAQQVIALDRADGRILWTAKVGPPWNDESGGPRGTPTVDGDLVYAIGTEGDLVCVEAAPGKERWRRSLARDLGGGRMAMRESRAAPVEDGGRLSWTP